MSVDGKKSKSPSSARKSVPAAQPIPDALFPEFPAHYPDLHTLHDDDPFVQSFERDVLYCSYRQALTPSSRTLEAANSDAERGSSMYTSLAASLWETRMGCAVKQYEQCRQLSVQPCLAAPEEPLTEETAACFRKEFAQHEVLVGVAMIAQSAEHFCGEIATGVVEQAASLYVARQLDAVKNAYTALALWDEVRDAVATSFLPRDDLSAVDAPLRSCASEAACHAPVRALLTAAQLVERSRKQPVTVRGCGPLSPGLDRGATALSPGSPPAPVPTDHFSRYVVEAAASHSTIPETDVEDEAGGKMSQPRASAAPAQEDAPQGRVTRRARQEAKPPVSVSGTTTATRTATAALSTQRVSAQTTSPRTKPVKVRKPTPPPKPTTTASTGARDVTAANAAAATHLTAQDDLTVALQKVAHSTQSAVFSATAPAGGAATARDAPSPPTLALSGKREPSSSTKRKPLYRIVGADAFPAHEVEREQSKMQSRRTNPKVAKDASLPEAALVPEHGTVYRFTSAKPLDTDTKQARDAAPAAPPVTDAATARTYVSTDAKRAAQIKEKQRLRRAEEERELRFVSVADGEATRALLERQLEVRPQPGVVVKQADGDYGTAPRRPGARPTRRTDEAAVLADGGEYVTPEGKKAWSDVGNAKGKSAARVKEGSRASAAAAKSPAGDAGKLPRVR